MTALLSKSCHEACGVRIQDYLERDGDRDRALARDFLNIAGDDAKRAWAQKMDRTRALMGTDDDWGGRKAVKYQHFVISPDPNDAVDLTTLRRLATAWASELFGRAGEPGRLGVFEVAIVYHDDNEHGIPHAHVIVNNANFDTSSRLRRLQISNRENKMISELCQDLSAELGLSRVPERPLSAPERGSFLTKAERAIRREGGVPWKQKIRDAAYIASLTAKDMDSFRERLSSFGVRVEEKAGDLTYQIGSNPRRRCSARRLGKAYTLEAVTKQAARTASMGEGAAARSWAAAKECLLGFGAVGEVERGAALAEVAFALRANETYGIRDEGDYDRALTALYARAEAEEAAGREEVASSARKAARDLERAKDVASKGDLFGVQGHRERPGERDRDAGGRAKKHHRGGHGKAPQQAQRRSIDQNRGSRGRSR